MPDVALRDAVIGTIDDILIRLESR
jgi:hypothetical protein